MSKGKRYKDEFKVEPVNRVTESGYFVQEVVERLDITDIHAAKLIAP